MKKTKVEVIAGNGRLRDRGTIEVGAQQIKAKNLVVATGSTVKSLPGMEFNGQYIVSFDHLTLSDKIPESICIIGAGAVGRGFATVFNQLGVKGTLIEGLYRAV